MNPPPTRAQLTSAVANLFTWLTVLQIANLLTGVAGVVLAVSSPGADSGVGLTRTTLVWLSGLQLGWMVLYALGWQWAKGWLGQMGRWAGGEAPVSVPALTQQTRLLSGILTLNRWLPLLLALVLGPLLWNTLNADLNAADLSGTGLSGQLRDLQLSPAQLRAAARLSVILSLVALVLPTLSINFAVLGWIQRWMRGVAQTALHGDPPARLPELAATIGRWFTFFQGLLVVLIALILLVPLLSAAVGAGSGLGGRLNLLLSFLNLALLFALLRWSKVVLAGVTARATDAAG